MLIKTAHFLVFAIFFAVTSSSSFSQLSFEEALKTAKTENKRVIVDIYTDWCGWCKKMDADTYNDSEIKKIVEENFIFIKLNAEGKGKVTYLGKQYTEEQLSYQFNVFSFPTTVFLEPDGKVIEYKYDNMGMTNLPGYFKAPEFKKILDYFKDGKYRDSDLSLVI